MGIANVVNMCAHLQNASRARLGLTSVPCIKYNLRLALALQKEGFIDFVARGGRHPPDPATLATHVPEPLTTANVSQQRLWLGLKYGPAGMGTGTGAVLHSVKGISTSKRPIVATLAELERACRGFSTHKIEGLTVGEALFLSTDRGVIEAREAVRRKVGGLLLCKISP